MTDNAHDNIDRQTDLTPSHPSSINPCHMRLFFSYFPPRSALYFKRLNEKLYLKKMFKGFTLHSVPSIVDTDQYLQAVGNTVYQSGYWTDSSVLLIQEDPKNNDKRVCLEVAATESGGNLSFSILDYPNFPPEAVLARFKGKNKGYGEVTVTQRSITCKSIGNPDLSNKVASYSFSDYRTYYYLEQIITDSGSRSVSVQKDFIVYISQVDNRLYLLPLAKYYQDSKYHILILSKDVELCSADQSSIIYMKKQEGDSSQNKFFRCKIPVVFERDVQQDYYGYDERDGQYMMRRRTVREFYNGTITKELQVSYKRCRFNRELPHIEFNPHELLYYENTVYVAANLQDDSELGNIILIAPDAYEQLAYKFGLLLDPNELTTPIVKMGVEKMVDCDYSIVLAIESFQLSVLYCLRKDVLDREWGILRLNKGIYQGDGVKLVGYVRTDSNHLLLYGQHYLKLYYLGRNPMMV